MKRVVFVLAFIASTSFGQVIIPNGVTPLTTAPPANNQALTLEAYNSPWWSWGTNPLAYLEIQYDLDYEGDLEFGYITPLADPSCVDLWVFSLNVNTAWLQSQSTIFAPIPDLDFPMYVDPWGAMNAINPPWLMGFRDDIRWFSMTGGPYGGWMVFQVFRLVDGDVYVVSNGVLIEV